jgi:hypothetical protein
MITDPKEIMAIIIDEFTKQIIANAKKRGLSPVEIEKELETNYKKLPRIAAVATKRIICG